MICLTSDEPLDISRTIAKFPRSALRDKIIDGVDDFSGNDNERPERNNMIKAARVIANVGNP